VLCLVYFNCIHPPLLADPKIGWNLRDVQLLFQTHAFIRADAYTFSLPRHLRRLHLLTLPALHRSYPCPLLAEEVTFLGQDNPEIDNRWRNRGIITLVLGFAVTHLPTTQELTAQSNTATPQRGPAVPRQVACLLCGVANARSSEAAGFEFAMETPA